MGMDRNVFLVLGFAILFFVAGEIPRALAAAGADKESPSPILTPSLSAKVDAKKKSESGSNNSASHPKAKSDANVGVTKANSTTPKGPSDLNDSPSLQSPSHGSNKGNKKKDASKNAVGPPIGTAPNASPKKEQEVSACKVHCNDTGNLTACLLDSGLASNRLILSVENQGEVTLTVKISSQSKTINQGLPLYPHKKDNVSFDAGETSKIILDAGDGYCTLQLQQVPASAGAPASPLNLFRLPSYATYMTPIYGAYLFFLTVLIIGGTWACCKFGRSRQRDGGGVPYQELEMGLPESSSAVGVDSADGWDQGWDDDWEEGKAVSRTQEIRRAANVSVNGLTSRSGNKEGWDDDWDD